MSDVCRERWPARCSGWAPEKGLQDQEQPRGAVKGHVKDVDGLGQRAVREHLELFPKMRLGCEGRKAKRQAKDRKDRERNAVEDAAEDVHKACSAIVKSACRTLGMARQINSKRLIPRDMLSSVRNGSFRVL